MDDQEIRAKALEITIRTISAFPQEGRTKMLASDGNKAQQNIINMSRVFEEHIRGKTTA
jgi:2'-5' RNA ligase